MARAFDTGSTQYLEYAGAIISAYPCTLACWAYLTDQALSYAALTLGHSSDASEAIALRYKNTTDEFMARRHNDAVVKEAVTSAHAINTWGHIAGTFSSSSCYAYVNGSTDGENSDAVNFPNLDRTDIGGFNNGGSVGGAWPGYLAEAAIWNVVLTAAEVAILAKGYSPLLVRPESLRAYWPLIRDTDDDIVGGFSMTAVNGPTVAAHPRIFYPGMSHVRYAPAAIAALRIPRHPAAYYGGPTIF